MQPLNDVINDFSEKEIAEQQFGALKYVFPAFANLTYDEGRQFFAEFKAENPDIPTNMSFEAALASNLFSPPERKKRSTKTTFRLPLVRSDENLEAIASGVKNLYILAAVVGSLALIASILTCIIALCCKRD